MIRQHHRITHVTALTLALAAAAAPCALADPAPLAKAEAAIAARQTPVVGPNADEQALLTNVTPLAPKQAASPGVRSNPDEQPAAGLGAGTLATRVARVGAPAGGFDWRDAEIGAGASLLLVGIGLAGARAVTSSRKQHTREPRATATG
jgi:hypothetical protein